MIYRGNAMKTSSNRKPETRRTFAQHFQATFGPGMDPRKLRRRGLLVLGVMAVLTAGAASADWRVKDQEAIRVLEKILTGIGEEASVNEKLKDLNTKLQIDQSASSETPEMIPEPTGDEKLDKQKPTQAQVDISKMCPSSGSTALAQQQKMLCEEVVKTELAQYRFSMRMFERAKENYDRLKKIEDERRGLGESDYADLQDNSNKLLALTALMDNDRDRYRTYMSAYEARVTHIRNARSALSRNAFTGVGGSTP